MKLEIKSLEFKDLKKLQELWSLDKEWRKWNGPYFAKETQKEINENIKKIQNKLLTKEKLEEEWIYLDGEFIGKVNWYYKSIETQWIEVGIVIMDENYWNKGLGTEIMRLWMKKVFERFPEIVRLGFTTWSGNLGMMKIGENLELTKEATYKNARIVNGKYYDSVSFGIQRDEFFNKK